MKSSNPEKKDFLTGIALLIFLIYIAVGHDFFFDIRFRLVDRNEGHAHRQAAATKFYVRSLRKAGEPIQIVRLRIARTCYVVTYQFHTRTSESASLAFLPESDCAKLVAAGAEITEINDLPARWLNRLVALRAR